MKKILFALLIIFTGILLFCVSMAGGGGNNVQKAKEIVDGNIEILVNKSPVISSETCQTEEGVKGVRDFAWLLDQNNNVIKEDEEYIAYANVFFDEENGPRIYRFISKDGINWKSQEISLERAVGIDEEGTSLGSVIKIGKEYFLYYSGLTKRDGTMTYYTYNVARSEDGLDFYEKETLLTDDAFKEIQHIGLPYTCYGKDGKLYMTCESIHENEYSIYGAISIDGREFTPLNDGNPVLSNEEIEWGKGGCANPKLHPISENLFLLGFNAFGENDMTNEWVIGAAIMQVDNDEAHITEISDRPLIENLQGKKRIESALFYSMDGWGNMIYFFATPEYDATEDAAIYVGEIVYK